MALVPRIQDIPTITDEELSVIVDDLGIVTPTMLENSRYEALSERLVVNIPESRFNELKANVNNWSK